MGIKENFIQNLIALKNPLVLLFNSYFAWEGTRKPLFSPCCSLIVLKDTNFTLFKIARRFKEDAGRRTQVSGLITEDTFTL